MTSPLEERIAASFAREIRPEVAEIARILANEADTAAVLFYGSNLRTGSLEGVLDFYVLTDGPAERGIWPRVSYREFPQADGSTLRAKIATLTLAKFARAAAGKSRDTTIWSRFVQPCAVVHVEDETAHEDTARALQEAAQTAGRLAAALHRGPAPEREFWTALFRATYRAEFRVEASGREEDILSKNEAHFDGLLVPALEAQGIAVEGPGTALEPQLAAARREEILRWWRKRQRLGKALNLARLAKATTTFEGAARYGAWKLERHSGVQLEMTPFRERHPILAAPGAWLEYRRKHKAGGKP